MRRAFDSGAVLPDSVMRELAAATGSLFTEMIDADLAASGIKAG
ncbi:hypothetical protein ACQPZP_07770 [Spirillospora sp. CA-142024]